MRPGRWIRILLLALFPAASWGGDAPASLDATRSRIEVTDEGLTLWLHLSRAVPFRVRHLQAPPRLAVDFIGADLGNLSPQFFASGGPVVDGAAGRVSASEARIVLQFEQPLVLEQSSVKPVGEGVDLVLTLRSATDSELAMRVEAVPAPQPVVPETRITRQDGTRPLRVMLDPGHGGIDPGAQRAGLVEADLMLLFARELRDVLIAEGIEAFLTRDDDIFVSLERRVALAQSHHADVLLSIHADALEEGDASGSTVYTISDGASDKLSKLLIQRQDRAEILSGVDLQAQDDRVADVLTDLVRRNTLPRARALADGIVASLGRRVGGLHKHPRLEASFSVLKAAEVPSVLLELGFLSSEADRARLSDPVWRSQAQEAIAQALRDWAKADAEAAKAIRR